MAPWIRLEVADRRTTEPVADSWVWQHLVTDQLPVADAAVLVGAVSDNLATNVLVDLLGLDAVQARARSMAPGGSIARSTRSATSAPRRPGRPSA